MKALLDFLREDTKARELNVIRDCGHVVQVIFDEGLDIAVVHPAWCDRFVERSSWGRMPVQGEMGWESFVPCRYIDLVPKSAE